MAAKNKVRFNSDIPNEQWLQEKREDTKLSERDGFGGGDRVAQKIGCQRTSLLQI